MPVQDPVKPGLLHCTVVPPAPPLKLALPVHRPTTAGPENVKVPVKELASTEPLIVPFQSRSPAAHVPLMFVPDCVRFASIAVVVQFDDARLPVQLPETFAGLGAAGVLLPPQAAELTRTAKRAKRNVFAIRPPG